MSWHFSLALQEGYLAENSLDGERFAPWKSIPFAPDDSCSDKMKDTFHNFQFGTMFVPSTDESGEMLLTWFLAASRARSSAKLTTDAPPQPIIGRKCFASSANLIRNTSLRKMSARRQFYTPDETLKLWDSDAITDALTLNSSEPLIIDSVGGYVATPTCAANQTAKSMQKHLGCRAYVSMFGAGPICPAHYEFLMGWPIGWTDSAPLETDRFQQWQNSHGIH